MGFSFDTVRFNGTSPVFPTPMVGLPVDVFLEASGKALDRYPSVALDVMTIYEGDDRRIYAANTRFGSFGGAITGPSQTTSLGTTSGDFFAGDFSIPASFGAYRGMELLLSPSGSASGPFWRTEIAEAAGGWLELRDPAPMLSGLAVVSGNYPSGDTSVWPIPDTAIALSSCQFTASVGDYVEIAGYRYRVLVSTLSLLVVEGGLWLGIADGTPVSVNRWPSGRTLYGQLYAWTVSADLDVMPTDDQLAGSGIIYGEPIAVVVKAIHTPTGAEAQKASSFTIDPPSVVMVAIVENIERRADGSSKLVNLILNRPIIKGNKLRLTASPILANKIGSQYLTGSLEFEPYGASVAAPPPDET